MQRKAVSILLTDLPAYAIVAKLSASNYQSFKKIRISGYACHAEATVQPARQPAGRSPRCPSMAAHFTFSAVFSANELCFLYI
jgi:hypothetical protein